MHMWITNGHVYTFSGFSWHADGLYTLAETGDTGYYPWRFMEEPDDFSRFMERVLKPVDLGKPVTA